MGKEEAVSITTVVLLHCEGCGLQANDVNDQRSIREVRSFFHDCGGWITISQSDYCPECAPAARKAERERRKKLKGFKI